MHALKIRLVKERVRVTDEKLNSASERAGLDRILCVLPIRPMHIYIQNVKASNSEQRLHFSPGFQNAILTQKTATAEMIVMNSKTRPGLPIEVP